MGRGKLTLKLIANEKSRKSTFFKRKKSLMKKAYELSTLCDVRTCVLINGPNQNDDHSTAASASELFTWPPNRKDIDGMINSYKASCVQKRARKSFNLHEFFSERIKKIESEITKLRKEVAEIKYTKSDERLDYFTEDQLRFLTDELDSKIEAVNRRIEGSRRMNNEFIPLPTESSNYMKQSDFFFLDPDNHQQFAQIEETRCPQALSFENSMMTLPVDQYHHHHPYNQVNYNSPMILSNSNYSICHYGMATQSSSVMPLSLMQFTDHHQNEVSNMGSNNHHQQFDYMDYEYLMNNFDNNCDLAVRQVASIHFKNYIAKNWAPHEPDEQQRISLSDKDSVRKNILPFVSQVPSLLRVQLGECLKTIVHED